MVKHNINGTFRTFGRKELTGLTRENIEENFQFIMLFLLKVQLSHMHKLCKFHDKAVNLELQIFRIDNDKMSFEHLWWHITNDPLLPNQ